MKDLFVRSGILVFFAAVVVISVVLMVNREDQPEIIEVDGTITETASVTESVDEETAETTAETHRYGRDIDFFPDKTEAEDNSPVIANEDNNSPNSDEHFGGYPTDETAASEAPATTRTVITSRQRKDYDKNAVYIDMKNILQNPELPVGCEITALTILLNHYGFNAEKTDLARNYLPTSWGNARYEDGKTYKDSFYNYFIGDPFSRGYGCFSGAIVNAAQKYVNAHGGGYDVVNISGCSPDTLYEYLIKGIPVVCWATDGMIEPEYYETWYDNNTGEQLDWYLNEHCFVLAGFDISGNYVTLNDPMKGIIDYNIDKFEIRFKQMHSQAIVLIPQGGAAETVTAAAETETEAEETALETSSEVYSESSSETSPEAFTEAESITFTESASDTVFSDAYDSYFSDNQ